MTRIIIFFRAYKLLPSRVIHMHEIWVFEAVESWKLAGYWWSEHFCGLHLFSFSFCDNVVWGFM